MKLVENSNDVRGKIISGLNKIADPVVQTLSPKGRNVLFEDGSGNIFVTNDGVTIARQIESEDPIEDAIIRTVRHAAMQTNGGAGDGTTTTTLYARFLVREGFRLKDDGMNEMDLKKLYSEFAERVVSKLDVNKVTDDTELFNIANISSNNDPIIAENVLRIVKTVGESGMVFINPSPNGKTDIIEDTGYVIHSGLLSPELFNDGPNRASYEDVAVLVTDKRLYYEEECHHILQTAIEAGITDLVIVAKDFIGKAPNFLMANHINGRINLLLVKHPGADKDNTSMSDLATYLGGKMVTEKAGKLIGKMTAADFITAKKVYATRERAVFQTVNNLHPELMALIEAISIEREKEPDNKEIERRLSSLTNGIVTVNVGGATGVEIQENIFRYEDAINATRAAMKHGYLAGGGLAVFNATRDEELSIFRKMGEESIRQIARNCGRHEDYILSMVGGDICYNAKTDRFDKMVEAGVIDPYKVTEMAIKNSVSVAIAILTSGFIIVNKKEEDGKSDN